jgi:hypothetical protein
VLVLLSIGLFILGLPRLFDQLNTLQGNFYTGIRIDAVGIRQGLMQLGISTRVYITYILSITVLFAIYCISIALLIVRKKFDDWMVLLISLSYVTYGTGYIYVISLPSFEIWPSPVDVVARFLYFFCGVILYVVFFYLFPDGRFIPGWTRLFATLVIGWGIYFTLYFDNTPFVNSVSGLTPLGTLITLLILVSVIVAQIYRYMYVSSPVQRQQTKWVVFGFSTAIILSVAFSLPGLANPALITPGSQMVMYVLALITFGAIFAVIGLLSLTLAILRYRLWDIDRLIRRTLVYSLLSGLLGAIYIGSVIVLHGFVETLTGREDNPPAIVVLSTLAIAALFKPFRDRIQGFIDNRFYQRKFNADKILEDFAQTVRDEIDLNLLSSALIDAVQESMHPEQVWLWFKEDATNIRQKTT